MLHILLIMVEEFKRIEGFGGKPMFEKAIMVPPFQYKTDLEKENRACFFYVLKGAYKTYADASKLELHAEDGVVKRCGPYLSQILKTAESDACEAVVVYLYEEVLKEIYEESLELINTGRNGTVMRKISSNELINRYIESLLFYFEKPSLVDDQLITLKLKELILLLLKTDKYLSIVELMSDLFRPREASFKKVIESHLYENISLDQLAHLTHMSLSSFKREFKRTYHQSPARYIKLQKLAKAASLLNMSDTPITTIAFDCGFSNPANFSTAFQQHYGISPKEYRLTQIQNS